jgi:hypothetical protein
MKASDITGKALVKNAIFMLAFMLAPLDWNFVTL